ncbi:DUF401 family protein [Stetteria hydrogenophila]
MAQPLVNPIAAFAAALAALLALTLRGWRVHVALAVMAVVYAALACRLACLAGAAARVLEWNDFKVFVYIFLSMLLAGVMREAGLLQAMVESLSSVSCRLSLPGIPALIGLMPMPGGALVSAIAMREKYLREARLSREEATFVNYWFRHIWVPSWPLFQSAVITASVFHLSPVQVVGHTWPGSLAAVAGGLAVAGGVMARARCRGGGEAWRFLAAVSPLASLAILALSGLNLLEALALVNLATIAFFRPGLRGLRRALALAARPTMHLVLFESLLLKNLLLETGISGAVKQAAAAAGIPPAVLAFLASFTLGLAAGGENFFAATAMPMLYSYIATPTGVDWGLLYTAYLGGFLGVMMSPAHLCLALTVDYYKSNLARVLARVGAAAAATAALGAPLATLTGGA